jgi:aldose 1-epimerase
MRLATFALLAFAPLAWAEVKEEAFGKMPDGKEVKAFTITNKNGMKAKVITYGAILTELHVPDKDGKLADVVLGFDNLEGYLKGHPYFGANVGRCANRVANAEFTLDDKKYTLAKNSGKHSLHGGKEGFDKKLWEAEIVEGEDPAVKFSYTSPDGEEGYPGELKVSVQYTLTADNELKLHFEAKTDKATLCSLAHHSYFNLAGHDAGSILKHTLKLEAAKYTPTDETLIPTGKIEPVEGTPFDFTTATEIGSRIKDLKGDAKGYDVNYAVGEHDGPALVATVVEPASGRKLEVYTSEPGLQFYTGNHLDGKLVGKGKAKYDKHGAFCLEAQYFPDAIHHVGEEGWYNPVITPEQFYFQDTIYKFSVQR